MEALQTAPRGLVAVIRFSVLALPCCLLAIGSVSAQDSEEKPADSPVETDSETESGSKTEADSETSKKKPKAADRSAPDEVTLLNGAIYRGHVIETGGNSIRLEIGGGSREFAKNEVSKIQFNTARESGAKLDSDQIQFRDGHTLDGDVEVLEGGSKVRIKLVARKKTGRSSTSRPATIVFPMAQVRRIRWKDELEFGSDGNYYTKSVAKKIATSIQDLSSGDEETRRKAEDYLNRSGVYAESAVAEAYKKRVAELPAATREKDSAVLALRRVQHSNQLKKIVPNVVQEAAPEIYAALSYANEADRKVDFLKAIIPNYAKESVELALFVIRDPHESERVRSLMVDLLRRLQLNQPLLNLYNGSGGPLKLVSAVALARNRILLGVPTMIESLELDDVRVRKLAADSLRETTGQDFRFRADGAIAARQAAAKKWRAWWLTEREEIEKNAVLVLRGGRGESPEWKQAQAFWKQGHAAWDKKNLTQAAQLLQQSVKTDPTFVKAAISLAALNYTELNKIKDAETILADLVSRPVVSMTPRDSYWIHYELANVYRIQSKHVEALRHYEESAALDPDSIYSLIGKGDCFWLMGTDQSKRSKAERRKLTFRAREQYLQAIKKANDSLESLKVLRSNELPSLDSLPFARRIHNRTVLDVRKGFGTEIVRLHEKIARVHTMSGDHVAAALELQKGLDAMSIALEAEEAAPLESSLRNYLALSFERQGKHLEAFKEYRHVLRHVDRENKASRRGLERLQRKVAQGK